MRRYEQISIGNCRYHCNDVVSLATKSQVETVVPHQPFFVSEN